MAAEKTKKKTYEPPRVLYFGPDLMEIGEELKVRCGGEGARELEARHFRLVEKYKYFGLFESVNGYRKNYSWVDVSKIMSLHGEVDNDFCVR